MYDYALLTTAGLESVALDALASEFGLRASALPAPTAPKGESFGSAGGLGILVASRQEPLAASALSAPVLQAALAVVARCEVEDGDVLAAAIGSVSEERWRSAMRTLAAHAAPVPSSAPSFRIASLRAGQHDFDSRALSSALGAAVGALQPSWRVDLEAPDVCVLALLVNRSLLIGALLPPFSPRKSDPLPMEPRQWLVRGERAHMRPHRAALLARLLAPADGEVLLDPTGGVGILAIEAALLASVTAHSVDLDSAACDAARANAAAAAPRLRGTVTVHCGDAARLGGEAGLPPASVDCVLADLPFGTLHRPARRPWRGAVPPRTKRRSRMLHARLDVGALLSALAVLVRPGGRCLLVGNAGPGGVAAAVVKASRRYPPGAWRVVRRSACASGGIACEAVHLSRVGEAAPRLGRLEKARGKVALEHGFGLAAWLRLSRGADLTGGVGPLAEEDEEAWPKWSLADVASHTTPEDSWMAIRGKVYNVSPYLRYHPGGADTLLDAAGTDATALFQQHHAWVNEDMLSACCVGTLRR